MTTTAIIVRAVFVVVFAVWAVGVCWLAWEQAARADKTPENDLDVRRRFNALEAKRAKAKPISGAS